MLCAQCPATATVRTPSSLLGDFTCFEAVHVSKRQLASSFGPVNVPSSVLHLHGPQHWCKRHQHLLVLPSANSQQSHSIGHHHNSTAKYQHRVGGDKSSSSHRS
uniref:Uncharacterized protein n=1 Tax=Eutreptiella gymnastica TaxID=73025 RepID=A0A7S4GD44_9EUGL